MSTSRDLLNAFKQRNMMKFQESLEIFKVNPNEKVKVHDDRSVFETILCTANSAQFIRLCLKNGADFYMKNKNGLGQYPLHCVIESQCLENLLEIEHLLDESGLNSKLYSSYVNVKQNNGENPLHILARSISNDNFAVLFEMMKILLSHGCNANYPNSEDKTACYMVLESLPKLVKRTEILNYFIENADIDFYTYRSKEMIEMIMSEELNYVLPERIDLNFSFESMKKLLDNYNINNFETLFRFFKSSCLDLGVFEDSCVTFMKIAVKKSFINIVDLLIEFGADINRVDKNSKFNIPPSFLTCANGKPSLLNLFLSQPNIKLAYEDNFGNQQTLLHQLFKRNEKPDHASEFHRIDSKEFTKEQRQCFDLLMDHPKCDRNIINGNDENKNPAIYYAVKYKNDYATMRLLMKGAYIGTVIKTIGKSLLEEFLNSTITTNNRYYEDDDHELKIDYTFLWPPNLKQINTTKNHDTIHQTEAAISGTLDQYSREVEPLQEMTKIPELQYLLAHPTIESFILLKWSRISFLIYINMIMILCFIFSFIPFAYLCQTLEESKKNSNFLYNLFRIISLASIFCMVIRELTQAMLSIQKYVCNPSNWIDICLMSLATIVLFFETLLLTPNWSRILRVTVILLATAEYFTILGMVPIMSISIYTKMFRKVCTTFLKSLAFFSMLIVSFAFCFYNMHGDKLSNDILKSLNDSTWDEKHAKDTVPTNVTRSDRFNNFYTVGSSIIKSFVMFTGELETSYVNIEGWTYATLFLLFVFLVTIVLYNLLNALAVSDTQEIKRDAKFIDLNQRISTMCDDEESIFRRNSKMGNWLKMVISLFPNTIPDGYVVVTPINRSLYVNNRNPIILTEWLPNQFEFLKENAKLNQDILVDIQNLLKTRDEELRIAEHRRIKKARNEKLANDIINMNEMISEIQKHITHSKNV